jgi:hypothetical protein
VLSARRQPRTTGILAWGCLLVVLASAAGADAQERKAYKYVDEKGNVVYSQTPPPAGKDAKQVNIAPAHRGSGGSTSTTPYDDPRRYSNERQDQYADRMREREKQAEEARRKRLAELEAECNRNRGADCKNPETLRLMESNQKPGGGYYPATRR